MFFSEFWRLNKSNDLWRRYWQLGYVQSGHQSRKQDTAFRHQSENRQSPDNPARVYTSSGYMRSFLGRLFMQSALQRWLFRSRRPFRASPASLGPSDSPSSSTVTGIMGGACAASCWIAGSSWNLGRRNRRHQCAIFLNSRTLEKPPYKELIEEFGRKIPDDGWPGIISWENYLNIWIEFCKRLEDYTSGK